MNKRVPGFFFFQGVEQNLKLEVEWYKITQYADIDGFPTCNTVQTLLTQM